MVWEVMRGGGGCCCEEFRDVRGELLGKTGRGVSEGRDQKKGKINNGKIKTRAMLYLPAFKTPKNVIIQSSFIQQYFIQSYISSFPISNLF